MVRELFKEMPYLTGVIGLMIGFLLLLLIDLAGASVTQHQGTVLDKHYAAETSNFEVGPALTSDGEIGVGTTMVSSPEQFVIMLRTIDQKVITVACTPELYYQKEVGDVMHYQVYRGLFTNVEWTVEPVE